MSSSIDMRDSAFPDLEYLSLVGYFTQDLSDVAALVSTVLKTLNSAFAEQIRLDNGVDVLINCRDPGSDRSDWTYSRELEEYQILRENTGTSQVRNLLTDATDRGSLRNLSISQPGKRSSVFRAFDFTWRIAYESSAVYPHIQYDCTCVVGLSTHLFPNDHKGVTKYRLSTTVADQIISDFLDHGDLYYAFMDANYFRADGAGWCCEQSGPSNWSSVRFRIEQELWTEAGEARRDRVRGVFPGQYLSPLTLRKLGGKEAFIADLLKVRDRRDDLITDLGERGIILRLAPTPIDATAYGLNQGFSEIATWVFRRFREAGLFL